MNRLVRIGVWTGLSVLVACAGESAPNVADAPAPGPGLVFVGAGLEEDAAIRACLGDPDGYDGREEMEPHVAIDPADPQHLVSAWMARVSGAPGAILAAGSRDGGRSWGRPVALPFNTCAGGAPGLPVTSDPWVSIGPEGRVYVTAMGWKPGEEVDSASVVAVVTSADGGDSWDDPVAASTARFPEFMHDNTAVASDMSNPGRLWIATTHLSDGGRPAAVTRSSDGGLTWSPLALAIPGDRAASAPQPVMAGGALYVFFGHGRAGSRVSFVRSDDAGVTWSDPVLVNEGAPVDGPLRFPGSDVEIEVAPDIMHAAADPVTGDLYVAFTTADTADISRPAVWLTASRDGGATWRVPILVGEPGEASWRPTLAVSPGGPAAVTYFRAAPESDPVDASVQVTEVRLRTVARGAGGELLPDRSVTLDRFAWAPRFNGTYFLGDYHGLAAAPNAVVAVFARPTGAGSRIVAVRNGLP